MLRGMDVQVYELVISSWLSCGLLSVESNTSSWAPCLPNPHPACFSSQVVQFGLMTSVNCVPQQDWRLVFWCCTSNLSLTLDNSVSYISLVFLSSSSSHCQFLPAISCLDCSRCPCPWLLVSSLLLFPPCVLPAGQPSPNTTLILSLLCFQTDIAHRAVFFKYMKFIVKLVSIQHPALILKDALFNTHHPPPHRAVFKYLVQKKCTNS